MSEFFLQCLVINPVRTMCLDNEQVLYSSTIERIVIETANDWFVEVVQDSIKQVFAAFSTRHP